MIFLQIPGILLLGLLVLLRALQVNRTSPLAAVVNTLKGWGGRRTKTRAPIEEQHPCSFKKVLIGACL